MRIYTISLIIAGILLGSATFGATTYYSIGSGSYTSTTIWSTTSCAGASCSCSPSSGTLVICTGTSITDASALSIGPGGISTLTIQSGATLTVNGNVDFQNNSNVDIEGTLVVNGTFTNDPNSNNVVINGRLVVNGNANWQNKSAVTGSGSVSVSGTSTASGGNAGTVFGLNPDCSSCSISTSGGVLPVSLISFNADNTGSGVSLSWITASETNNKYFTVERSVDGVNYTTVGNVNGSGTTTTVRSYSLTDDGPAKGINYYRLSQTDFDGNKKYIGNVAIEVENVDNTVSIFPNPATGSCNLNFNDSKNESLQLSVYDNVGRIVMTKNIQAVVGSNLVSIDISALAPGMYFLSLPVNTKQQVCKLIRQ